MDKEEYIFGSESNELQRLGFQHKVWSEEAFAAWKKAEIKSSDIILDVGAGPGFASIDLSYLASKVIAIEKSEVFSRHLESHCKKNNIKNLEVITQSIDSPLNCEQADIAYSRWVFSWLQDPLKSLQNISDVIKPGGKIIFQEYCFWGGLHLEPFSFEFAEFYKAARKSFATDIGNVDIGYKIPEMLTENGFSNISLKPLLKTGKPKSPVWNWVKSFAIIYGKKLVSEKFLSETQYSNAIVKINELESREDAFFSTPQMIEIIAEKL